METKRWYILFRDGTPMSESEVGERPSDAQPSNGDPFKPWYKNGEHLHIENQKISGIHAIGTLESVRGRLNRYLKEENRIIKKFGSVHDIFLPDLDQYLVLNFIWSRQDDSV